MAIFLPLFTHKPSFANRLALLLLLGATTPRGMALTDTAIVHGTALVVGVAIEGVVLGQDHLRGAGSETLKPIIQKFSFCATDVVCGTAGLAQHNFFLFIQGQHWRAKRRATRLQLL